MAQIVNSKNIVSIIAEIIYHSRVQQQKSLCLRQQKVESTTLQTVLKVFFQSTEQKAGKLSQESHMQYNTSCELIRHFQLFRYMLCKGSCHFQKYKYLLSHFLTQNAKRTIRQYVCSQYDNVLYSSLHKQSHCVLPPFEMANISFSEIDGSLNNRAE